MGVLKKKQENENSTSNHDRVQNIKLFIVKDEKQRPLEKLKTLAELIEAESVVASPLEIYFTCDLEK